MAHRSAPSASSLSPTPAAVASMRTSSAAHWPAGPIPVPSATTRPPRLHVGPPADDRVAERWFLDWLADPAGPDEPPNAADGRPMPMTVLLGRLTASSRGLPAEATDLLGLDEGATIGAAAVELVVAVNDPAGPRCRSYRAAVAFVQANHRFLTPREDG